MQEQDNKKQASASSSQQEAKLFVNPEYWYEERDINQLLELRVKDLQPSLEEPIFVAPCLDNVTHYGLKAYLSEEKTQRQRKLPVKARN